MTLEEFFENLISSHEDYWESPDFQEVPYPNKEQLQKEIEYLSILYLSDENAYDLINSGKINILKSYINEKYDELTDKYLVSTIYADLCHANKFLDSLKEDFDEMHEYHQQITYQEHVRRTNWSFDEKGDRNHQINAYKREENLLRDYYPSVRENDFRGIIKLYDTIFLLNAIIKSLEIYKSYSKSHESK